MKAIDWKSIFGWWGKMFRKDERKNEVNNEEKPTQSTRRLKNFLYKRFDFRYNWKSRSCLTPDGKFY